MAKKSPSAVKKTKPTRAKTAAKAPAKAIKKTAGKTSSKPGLKPATKATKPAKKDSKQIEKKGAKPAVAALKLKSKLAATKPVSKPVEKSVKGKEISDAPASKPALMTKKGKAEPVTEADEEVTAVEAEATPAKAEKVSKVKPIRIEKGNLDDEKAKWNELFKKYGKDKAIPYKMSETFASLSPVQHTVLGWGFILKNDNDRMEVLFETGIRMLISNYKS